MSRVIINKKKIKNKLIIKFFIIIFLIIFFILFLNWLINNNLNKKFISTYIELLSNKYNYVLKEVEIEGLKNVPKKEINIYFLEYYDKSIFLLPLREISKKIKENHWIKSVIIKSNFKNKVHINLVELEPVAVYFNGKNYLLIDELGQAIDFANEYDVEQYIIVFGEHSKENVKNLIEVIPSDLKIELQKAEYINNRRWNIYLIDNLKIKLPEIEYKKAMEDFIDIYDNLSLSDISKIDFIDLRISERAIIKFYNNK